MRTIAELALLPVWVNPDHLVLSARLLMSGHRTRAVAVRDHEQIVGVLSLERARASDDRASVESTMEPVGLTLEGHMPVHRAAEVFTESNVDWAVVEDDGRFLGLLTPQLLLKELRRPWDARTGLGSGERLKEWAIDQLRERKEISILFFDLNDFGLYNKQYGHLVGDRVLRRFSSFLKGVIDANHDVLVRYAGDEFAIGSLRNRAEAEALAQTIKDRAESELFDDQDRPITFCIGISGGRRSSIREDLHLEACYDDLLNAASRACMAAKEELKKRARRAD